MTTMPPTPSDSDHANHDGDADFQGSGIEKTTRDVDQLPVDEDVEIDAELSSAETMAHVREHYEDMTELGAMIDGEGKINGVVVDDE